MIRSYITVLKIMTFKALKWIVFLISVLLLNKNLYICPCFVLPLAPQFGTVHFHYQTPFTRLSVLWDRLFPSTEVAEIVYGIALEVTSLKIEICIDR